ncbi:MAG: FtsQ-type POTRA domain-containing protein [Acidimicrobiales bacterium]
MPALLTRARPAGDDEVIDPRIRARRDEVARGAGRRRRRVLLALLVVVAVGAAAFGLSRTPLLDVDDLGITGAAQTPADQVVAAAGIQLGQPLVGVDEGSAAARVERLPWVRSASVTRGWDGHVGIDVTERTAELQMADGAGGFLALDGDGRVLGAGARPAPGVPAVEGLAPAPVGTTVDPRVRDAVTVARALPPSLRTRVTAIRLLDRGAIELGLRPAGRVRFGPAEAVPAKVQALVTIFGQVDLRDLCGIDLRVPEAPVLTRSQPCA